MVAHAVEMLGGHGCGLGAGGGVHQLAGVGVDALDPAAAPGAVLVGDAEGGDAGAVQPLPEEGVGGDVRVFNCARAHHHIGIHAALPEYLGQRAAVAEGVDIVAHAGDDAQVLVEVPLAQQALPGEALPAGQVTVGLDPPAAHDAPATLVHPLADTREHLGAVGLPPRRGRRRRRW